MSIQINSSHLQSLGLAENEATKLCDTIRLLLTNHSAEETWKHLSKNILTTKQPFAVHSYIFKLIFPQWPKALDTAPAYIPDESLIKTTSLYKAMQETGKTDLHEFHQWSCETHGAFWEYVLKKLHIKFIENPTVICDLSQGLEQPIWLNGAKFNIIDSCFNAPKEKTAIIFQNNKHQLEKVTYAELEKLTNCVANSLIKQNFKPGDPIAIIMPMTLEAVILYLGVIKMGGVVVSIADSFSAQEIETRLNIAKTKGVFIQANILRDEKKLPLYAKLFDINAPKTIVLPTHSEASTLRAGAIPTHSEKIALRPGDITWAEFLISDDTNQIFIAEPMQTINIIFSSGTTGEPKAIPWNHTTAIKAASDGYFHQNIQPDDITTWPTNLGWMMGPWIIFATLINQATLAIYTDAPRGREFGEFVQNAKVTMLGLVPALVALWRQSGCMEGLDWSAIQRFSSSGECSNAEDMLYLMYLAGYKPIIEYCGGTEIGGAYISSTLLENNYPSVFTTPTMGSNFVILDEEGKQADLGEVAIIPPSMGLSNYLVNADHHKIYFADMPHSEAGRILRRHGDQIAKLSTGKFCVLGRVDDTMNLGAIKVSSAEIERVLVGIEGIRETAAIAVTPLVQGPSLLVIYAATNADIKNIDVKKIMQLKINQQLNPLFKIHDVVFINDLPKTASNKIMRRVLRKQYQSTMI